MHHHCQSGRPIGLHKIAAIQSGASADSCCVMGKRYLGRSAGFWAVVATAVAAASPGQARADPLYRFVRGDINGDGGVNLTDSIFLLNHLFQGGPAPSCMKAADVNNDGNVNLTDSIFLLNFLFQGGTIPDAPNLDTGPGFEVGGLACITDDPVLVETRPNDGGDLAMGLGFSCAIVTAMPPAAGAAVIGPVACWGANDQGQLGVGDLIGREIPTLVAEGFVARQVVAGDAFACALVDDGEDAGGIRCWGDGNDGALGFGQGNDKVRPFDPVFGFDVSTPAIDIAAGARHACAIRETAGGNQLRCWGYGEHGRLGFSADGAALPGLVDLGDLQPVDVTAGDQHTCVAMDNGDVYCFGNNDFFQLDNDVAGGPTPRRIDFLDGGVDEPVVLDAGAYHTCALGRTGTRECWGDFLDDTEDLVASISNGGVEFDGYACFTTFDDEILCDNNTAFAPFDATTLPPRPRTMALGPTHGCAIYDAPVTCPGDDEDSTLCCFGTNDDGELGNERRPQPSLQGVAVHLPVL